MTHTADIPLASGLRRIVDDALVVVRLGVRRFWRGGAHANAPAGEAMSLLNRLARLLRFAFVILAVHLELPARRLRTAGASPANRRPARAPAVRLRRPTLALFPPYRIRFDDHAKGVVPPAFAAPRDRILIAQRKLNALTRALADPMPLIRRMARRLPTQLMVFGWRPPKRPPPLHKRDYCEELNTTFFEAKYVLSAWRRRTRIIPEAASGS